MNIFTKQKKGFLNYKFKNINFFYKREAIVVRKVEKQNKKINNLKDKKKLIYIKTLGKKFKFVNIETNCPLG